MSGTPPMRSMISIASVVLAVAAIAAHASAVAAWTPAVEVSPPNSDTTDPRVAVDDEGDAVIVWHRFVGGDTRVQARTRSAAGVIGPVMNLSAPGVNTLSAPEVDVDADGDALVVWERGDRIQARELSAAGSLSPVQNLCGTQFDAFNPEVGLDPGGDAVVVWQASASGVESWIRARTRSATGELGPQERLTPPGGPFAHLPEVGVDADGDAVVGWRQFVSGDALLATRARAADGMLSPIQTVSNPGQDIRIGHELAVDDGGNAVFTWAEEATRSVLGRARSAAGTLDDVESISSAGDPASQPQVAIDPEGDAVFTWTQVDDAGVQRARVRGRSAAGVLGPMQTLTGPGAAARNPQVGVGDDGAAVLGWRRQVNGFRIEARTRTPGGILGPVVPPLSDSPCNAVDPALSVGGGGDAALVWLRAVGFDTRVEASFGP